MTSSILLLAKILHVCVCACVNCESVCLFEKVKGSPYPHVLKVKDVSQIN